MADSMVEHRNRERFSFAVLDHSDGGNGGASLLQRARAGLMRIFELRDDPNGTKSVMIESWATK